MATWLAFPDLAAAQAAVAQIDANKGLPLSADAVTRTWAVPALLADGRFAIPKCRDADLGGVDGFDAVDDPAWPVTQDVP